MTATQAFGLGLAVGVGACSFGGHFITGDRPRFVFGALCVAIAGLGVGLVVLG